MGKQPKTSLTPIKKRVGVLHVISALKAAPMTCLPCAINRESVVAFGPNSVQRHVAVMTGGSSSIRSVVVACWMLRSQQVTLQDLFVVAKRSVAQICLRRSLKVRMVTRWVSGIRCKGAAQKSQTGIACRDQALPVCLSESCFEFSYIACKPL